jgi:lipoprotein-releasing system permease protein
VTFEWFVSRRYLHPRAQTIAVSVISFISILGVTLGVMVLLVVISVMNGFESDLLTKVIGSHSHLVLQTGFSLVDFQHLQEAIHSVPDVEGSAPVILGQGLIRSRDYAYGAQIKGIDPRYEKECTQIEANLILGSLVPLEEEIDAGGVPVDATASELPLAERFRSQRLPGIVLGKELAKKLYGYTAIPRSREKQYLERIVGGRVLIGSPIPEDGFGGSRWRQRWFEVVGITESGLFDYDDMFAFVSLPSAQYLYRLPSGFSRVEIKLKKPEQANEARDVLRARLFDTIGDVEITTWMEFNQPLFRALQIEKIAMFVILVMIILVAGFSVAATLIMTVIDKTREIGVLRALGATKASVARIFLRCGLIVGITGTVLGCILGLGICLYLKYEGLDLPGGGSVYYIDQLPVEIRLLDFFLIAVVTLGTCVLAAVYPARTAARLVPVEALRYE